MFTWSERPVMKQLNLFDEFVKEEIDDCGTFEGQDEKSKRTYIIEENELRADLSTVNYIGMWTDNHGAQVIADTPTEVYQELQFTDEDRVTYG